MSNILNNDIIDPPVPKAYLHEAASENASAAKSSSGPSGIFSRLSATAARITGKSLDANSDTAASPALSSSKIPAASAKSLCELPYFRVAEMLGGNQELFSDPWMKIGGCAAVTACDLCIYMDMYKGTDGLYPYDIAHISKEDYERFAMLMKPYLRPRYSGINKTQTYIDGFSSFLEDHGYKCDISDFDLSSSYSEARSFVISSIDAGFPIAYLNLYHRDPAFSDFVWHWFLLTGYAVYADTMMVKVISYGECYWFDFARLLNTGHRRKGGMVRINSIQPR